MEIFSENESINQWFEKLISESINKWRSEKYFLQETIWVNWLEK